MEDKFNYLSNRTKIISITIISNILEYYDFFIYSYFIKEIGNIFFPQHEDSSQIILSLSIFVVGFIARPVGGIIFGYIGDRYGRRRSLLCSIMGISLTTLLIGILPGYELLGISASIILLMLRIIQGMCLAGEGPGAAIFAIEYFKLNRNGLVGALITASNSLGLMMGLIIGIMLHKIIPDEFSQYIWRISFIFGGIGSIIGFFLRYNIQDSGGLVEKSHAFPLKELLLKHPMGLIRNILLGGICGSSLYFIVSYLNLYLTKDMNIEPSIAKSYMMISLLSNMFFLPIFGYVADKLDNKKSCMIFGMIFLISTCFILSNQNNQLYLNLICFGLNAAIFGSCAYKYMSESFDKNIRFSAIAFGFNLGLAMLGSTMQLISIAVNSYFPNVSCYVISLIYMAVLVVINMVIL